MIELPSYRTLTICMFVNVLFGLLIFSRIYKETKIMRKKDDTRD